MECSFNKGYVHRQRAVRVARLLVLLYNGSVRFEHYLQEKLKKEVLDTVG